jgi:glycogen(starch) synthase
MLDALEEHYGLPPVSLLIPNGRNAAQFAPGIKEEFVLTAGRLSDQAKNLSALDSVASKLPWPVYAVGDGTRFNNVRKLGWQSPRCLAHWMARASIYALPARYEPFGLSALEAAQAGCALVLGDIPSLREVWGDTAIYVPPDDHYGLQGALEMLMEDPSLRVDLAARARARALTFSACRMAERYVTAYKLAWDIRESRPRRLTRCG